MSKRFFAIILIFAMLLLVGCNGDSGVGGNNEGNSNENGGNNMNNGSTENGGSKSDGFVLKAIVKSVNDDMIEVEVIESDYAFGIYWVRTGLLTSYRSADGGIAARSDIKAGDTVRITYNGQTMMSLPPQIVAIVITIE